MLSRQGEAGRRTMPGSGVLLLRAALRSGSSKSILSRIADQCLRASAAG
jgi:hypothetical protein